MYLPGKTITAALFGLLAAAVTGWGQRESPVEVSATNIAALSIEQLANLEVTSVYGASKYEQRVTQAPSSVSIITADEIQKFGYRTLAEILRSIRGLHVSNDRNYSYLGVRGFLRPGDYNTRVLVLIDGHRMNDNIYDASDFGRENMIDVGLIDRVEVIRGPSSSIYGSSAFFGVINILTKRGQQIGGAEVSAEAGSFDSYKGSFSFGEKFRNDVELLFSGSYYSSEGPRRLYYPEFDQRISSDPRAANNGIAENSDGEEAFQIYGSLGYHDLTLSTFFSERTKQIPTASFDTIFNDGRERTDEYRAYADLKFEHAFNEDTHLLARAFYDGYFYYGDYPEDHAEPGDPPFPVVNKDEAFGEWAGTEWMLTRKLFDRHTLILGAEYRENLRQHQSNYDDDPRAYYLDDNRTGRTVGLYTQTEVALLTNLLLNAGARYDHYFEGFGGTLNPRASLIYSPWVGSSFKALYGEAFRAPNAYERFYSGVQATLPELQPETIRTYELAYEQYFARNYRSCLAGYHYEVDRLISQIMDPAGEIGYVNAGTAEASGVEFELEGKYDSGLRARASYAFQRTEDTTTGKELTSSPRHLAKLNLSVPLYRDNLFAGFELQYNGAVRTLAGHRADDFVLANLTLFSREIVKGLEVSASVYNLFDTKYGYPGAEDHLQEVIQQDGRTFRVKLTYRF